MIFGAVVVGCLLGAAAYVAWAALRGTSSAQVGSIAAVQEEPHVVFQHVGGTAGDAEYARVALAPVDGTGKSRVRTALVCERVHFAAGRGICLVPEQDPLRTGFEAKLTDSRFRERHEVRLSGIPSRARVSPDGRYAATTSFVNGHSYAQDSFSTQTVLIDVARGKVLANLEKDFTVFRNGRPTEEEDFNFWGVTFTRDGNRFYATLRTRGKTYLLEGDIARRRARVLHENVECPSLSPDNRRVAYKKRVDNVWRLHVLDLSTMRETPLAETRPVDDQVEWLDDERILYGVPPDTWVVPADGSGAPRRFLAKALSPAVVR